MDDHLILKAADLCPAQTLGMNKPVPKRGELTSMSLLSLVMPTAHLCSSGARAKQDTKKAAAISRERGKENKRFQKDPFPSQKLQTQQDTTGEVSHPLVKHSGEQMTQWSPEQLSVSSDKRNKSTRKTICVNSGLDVPLSEVQLA